MIWGTKRILVQSYETDPPNPPNQSGLVPSLGVNIFCIRLEIECCRDRLLVLGEGRKALGEGFLEVWDFNLTSEGSRMQMGDGSVYREGTSASRPSVCRSTGGHRHVRSGGKEFVKESHRRGNVLAGPLPAACTVRWAGDRQAGWDLQGSRASAVPSCAVRLRTRRLGKAPPFL